MNKTVRVSVALLLIVSSSCFGAEEFLSDPSLLQSDDQYGADKIYFVDNIAERLQKYDSVMVDEPEIFIAPDSPYGGFKASDIAVLSDMLRVSFIGGMTAEPVTIGNFKAVDEAGPSTLYLRMALKNVYIKKKRLDLFAYTPVGAVAKGVHEMANEAVDKSTLVEMRIEGELYDSTSKESLAMIVLERGQRKAHHQREDAAGWEMSGALAEVLGSRLACRLDNARLPESQRRDCVGEMPFQQ